MLSSDILTISDRDRLRKLHDLSRLLLGNGFLKVPAFFGMQYLVYNAVEKCVKLYQIFFHDVPPNAAVTSIFLPITVELISTAPFSAQNVMVRP